MSSFRVGLPAFVVALILSASVSFGQTSSPGGMAPSSAPATAPVTPNPGPAGAPGAQAPADTPLVDPAPVPAPPAAVSVEPSRSLSPHAKGMPELSPWSMFMEADILVKAVMIGLAFASVLTWTIFLGKTAELMLAQSRLKKSMHALEGSGSLLEAQIRMSQQRDVTSVLVQQAVHEMRLSADIPGEAGLRERVASRFSEVQKAEGRIIRRGMGLLATMGSTAPFVGLFGTVWGIMNSFIGISKSQTTNLAVVAPGIAEALLATAIGLVAAIPAVIVYNHFARATKGYMEGVGRAAGAVGRLLSRDLDRSRGRPLAQAAE